MTQRNFSLLNQLLGCLLALAFCAQSSAAHERLGTIEFKAATVGDAARVISELSKVNIVVTEAARDKVVSLYLKQASVESTVDALCRVSGLWYRKNPDFNAYYIMTEDEFKKDIVVERHYITRIFELKHQNISDAANAIASLFGTRVTLSEPGENKSYSLDGDFGGGGSGSSSSSDSSNSSSGRSSGSAGSSGSSDIEVETRRSYFNAADLVSADQVIVTEKELINKNVRSEPPIYVTWNHLHNLLLVRTSDKQALKEIENLITRIDQPAQQVLLEMKIIRATLGDEERSVFDINYQTGSLEAGVDEDGNILTVPEVDLSLGNFPLEGGAFLARLAGKKLSATIELLRTENRIDLLAQPNIISANNKEATLTIGEGRILITGASTDTITNDSATIVTFELDTEERNIGTSLSIWPRINGDKTVTLDIEQSNTSLNKNSGQISLVSGLGDITTIAIDSVTASTVELTAIARHGATIAIGGMIETDKQEVHDKVPFFGDIPILGKLFRRDYSKDVRSELIILITPWISEDPQNAHVLNQERTSEWADNPGFSSFLSVPEDKHPPTHWPLDTRKKAMSLIQQAVFTKEADSLINCPESSTKSSPRFTDWHLSDSLQLDALGHCQYEELYLTLAQIINTSDTAQNLRPDLFNQGWIASQGERALLPAKTSQLVYFVSETSPDVLLQKNREQFFYGEGVLDAQ
ncbi:hypothetical protein A9Q99_05310 [Gammaproteobacteria bacterium 45_16_T64]|nr:hypothetical protein A9Q99_05310 [Gammaproteobacteria bacterium 45_16_T64]